MHRLHALFILLAVSTNCVSAWRSWSFDRAPVQGQTQVKLPYISTPRHYPRTCQYIPYKDEYGPLGPITGLQIQQLPSPLTGGRTLLQPLSMLAFYLQSSECDNGKAKKPPNMVALYYDDRVSDQTLKFDSGAFGGTPKRFKSWKEVTKGTDEWRSYVEGYNMRPGDVLWRPTVYLPFRKKENVIVPYTFGGEGPGLVRQDWYEGQAQMIPPVLIEEEEENGSRLQIPVLVQPGTHNNVPIVIESDDPEEDVPEGPVDLPTEFINGFTYVRSPGGGKYSWEPPTPEERVQDDEYDITVMNTLDNMPGRNTMPIEEEEKESS